jgi:hypothetical protein
LTEVNNDYFTLERSKNGLVFTGIEKLSGSGTHVGETHYTAKDEAPLNERSYYRLKQTDFDGRYSYSPVVTVKVALQDPTVTVFPNPYTSGEININASGFESGENLPFRLLSPQGSILTELIISTDMNGKASGRIASDQLASGIYFVVLAGAKKQYTTRLIVP